MHDIEMLVLDWATEAADAFLNRKVDLNTSIRKIAQRESLNREKVARVVEEANKTVFLKMFEKSADKCFTFDVADANKVLGEAEAAGVKAGTLGRITAPPAAKAGKTASQVLLENSLAGFGAQQAWDAMQKAILALEMFREKAAMARERVIDAETCFCKAAQQMVLQEGYSFQEILEALVSCRPRQFGKIATLLKASAAHLGRKFRIERFDELIKRAGAPVDPNEHDVVSRISAGGMPVEVINGSHKIVIALDTLIDQATEFDKANKNLWSADDTVKYLRRELRNYLATHRHV